MKTYEELRSELIAFGKEVEDNPELFEEGYNYFNANENKGYAEDDLSIYKDTRHNTIFMAVEFKGIRVVLYSEELVLPFNLSLIQIAAYLQEAKKVFNIIKQKHGKS